jgi:hypothetical protein
VSLLITRVAEASHAASALDIQLSNQLLFGLYHHLTVFARAELHAILDVHKAINSELLKLNEFIIREQLFPNTPGHVNSTAVYNTLRVDAFGALSKFFLDEILETLCTSSMPTIFNRYEITLIHLEEADGTFRHFRLVFCPNRAHFKSNGLLNVIALLEFIISCFHVPVKRDEERPS